MRKNVFHRIKLLLTAILTILCWSGQSYAQPLPPVTGASYDGQQISWDPLPEAIGYNVYLDFNYRDTVTTGAQYTPDSVGEYRIVGFDGEGNFSPLKVVDENDAPNSNFADVDTVSNDVLLPENVTGIVYSRTAGEIFWDRNASRSLEYDVYLNEVLIGSTTGTSFFIDVLTPDATNKISVAAKNCCGTISDQVALIFDTGAAFYPESATPLDSEPPTGVVPSPQNVIIEIYDATSAELFWDRPPSSAHVVSTDIFRDGVLLGSSPGISFYDNTREIGARNRYELIAINTDGVQSTPTILNPGALDGDAQAVVQRLTSGIAEVTNDNPHQLYFNFLRSLTGSNLPEELTQISSERVTDDNGQLVSRRLYNCESGTLTRDNLMSRFGSYRLVFDFCDIENNILTGEVIIGITNLGGYNATYNNLYIEGLTPGTEIDGLVSLSIGRANNFRTLSYESLNYYFIGEDDIDTSVELNMQLLASVTPASQPRTELTTNFSVSAPWTLGETIMITTNKAFTEAELGNGIYLNGELTAESPNGDRMVFTVETGDASTWQATVFKTDGSTDINGNWSDTDRLPCISANQGADAIPGCDAQ